MTDLDRLDALAEEHDFRHWHVDMNAPNHVIVEDGSGKLLAKCYDVGHGWTADAIEKAVRAIPELLAAVRERDELREAAVAVCRLWFTDNAPEGSQHVRKAMIDLRAALHPEAGA